MLFKARVNQLITCLNVSKASSPAFSPPLLTKASSFSRRSLTLSSFSPGSHTFKPNRTGHTHSEVYSIYFLWIKESCPLKAVLKSPLIHPLFNYI